MKRLTGIFFLTTLMTGCRFAGGPAWISAAQYDNMEYAGVEIGVAPVAFAETIDIEHFPAKPLQRAVADRLSVLGWRRHKLIEANDEKPLYFPATPGRLRSFGVAHGYKAVVGITALRFEVQPASDTWSFTGNITFVDVGNPDRFWTMAKTWAFVGTPTADFQTDQLIEMLNLDLHEVRRALQRGRTSRFFRRDTVIVAAGPTLNLDIAKVERYDVKPFLKIIFNSADKEVLKTSARQAEIDVSAIDDYGIVSLAIDRDGKFTYIVDEDSVDEAQAVKQQGGTPPEKRRYPILVAQRTIVDLAPGMNHIDAVAMNGRGEVLKRRLEIFSKSSDLESGVTEVMLVAASSYANALPDIQLGADADARIAQLVAREGTSLDGSVVLPLTGSNATRPEILRLAADRWAAKPADGARRVIAYIGRAEVVGGEPYLLLYDTRDKLRDIGSMRVSEFAALAKFDVDEINLDLCTEDGDPALVERAVKTAGGEKFKVAMSTGCASHTVGARFLEFNKDNIR